MKHAQTYIKNNTYMSINSTGRLCQQSDSPLCQQSDSPGPTAVHPRQGGGG
jgi:hypothetical protein